MALSDELLADPTRLDAVREHIVALVDALRATAGFLVDEDGAPFAGVGHVEFGFPQPLASLRDNDALLEAMVGEQASADAASGFLVARAGHRALLAVVLDRDHPTDVRRVDELLDRAAAAIAKLL